MSACSLHVPSLVIGVLVATVVLMSMGQSSPVLGPPRIEYGPHPRDMVQIKEGTSYTVPVGRIFVLTGLGTSFMTTNFATLAELRVNGQREVCGGIGFSTASSGTASGSVPGVPMGFTVPAGAVIDVDELTPNLSNGRAWGYLSQP